MAVQSIRTGPLWSELRTLFDIGPLCILAGAQVDAVSVRREEVALIKVVQDLDTEIEVRAVHVFARVMVRIPHCNGDELELELDMESFVRVMKSMDGGEAAVTQVARQAPVGIRGRIMKWFGR